MIGTNLQLIVQWEFSKAGVTVASELNHGIFMLLHFTVVQIATFLSTLKVAVVHSRCIIVT